MMYFVSSSFINFILFLRGYDVFSIIFLENRLQYSRERAWSREPSKVCAEGLYTLRLPSLDSRLRARRGRGRPVRRGTCCAVARAARMTSPRMTPRGDTTVDRQNFGKLLLVFGCIGTDLCKKIRVLQHFSKSTRLSSLIL